MSEDDKPKLKSEDHIEKLKNYHASEELIAEGKRRREEEENSKKKKLEDQIKYGHLTLSDFDDPDAIFKLGTDGFDFLYSKFRNIIDGRLLDKNGKSPEKPGLGECAGTKENLENTNSAYARSVAHRVQQDHTLIPSLKEEFAKVGMVMTITPIEPPAITVEVALPEKAPKLWVDRASGINAAQFLRETYAPWIEAGVMTRSAIKTCDPQLYNAYAVWLHRHPEEVVELADGIHQVGRQPSTDLVSLVESRRKADREAKAIKRAYAKMSHLKT